MMSWEERFPHHIYYTAETYRDYVPFNRSRREGNRGVLSSLKPGYLDVPWVPTAVTHSRRRCLSVPTVPSVPPLAAVLVESDVVVTPRAQHPSAARAARERARRAGYETRQRTTTSTILSEDR